MSPVACPPLLAQVLHLLSKVDRMHFENVCRGRDNISQFVLTYGRIDHVRSCPLFDI